MNRRNENDREIGLLGLLRKRNQKDRLLRRHVKYGNWSAFDTDKVKLEAFDFLFRRRLKYFMVFFLEIPIALAAVILSSIYLIGREHETSIYAELTVRSIWLDSLDNQDKGYQLAFSAEDAIQVIAKEDTSQGKLSGSYKTKDGLKKDPLRISFVLPVSNALKVEVNDTTATLLTIEPHSVSLFSYQVSGTGLYNVVGQLDHTAHIRLHGQISEELDPLIASQVSFADLKKKESYLVDGVIKLLDTKEDSIILNRENYLHLDFAEKAKFYISREKNGLHVKFNAKVKQINTAYDLSANDMTSRMPLKIRASYDEYPYLWLIIPVILPLLISLFNFFKK